MNIEELSSAIKKKAKEVGFSFCGISKVEMLQIEANSLKVWLNNNYHAEMHYMENYFEKRTNPALLFENAKSVISVLMNYYPENKIDKNKFQLAKYAYGNDYHYIIKSKLNEVIDFIKSVEKEVNARSFCDSAPIMDKVWAQKSGLGWIGKNTCLIVPKAGSFFLIGEILLDIDLVYDQPAKNKCGSCTRCVDACPTNALTQPYLLDARKCLSYLTIEHKSEFDENVNLHNQIFGCDICQDVCPWNIKFAKQHSVNELAIKMEILNFTNKDWQQLEKKDFKAIFKNTSLERTAYERFKRNILAASDKKDN
jgi:epoxyqueuosine reductase